MSLFIFSLVIIYMTKRFMATENIYKKPIILGCPVRVKSEKKRVAMEKKNPYMLFNRISKRNKFLIQSRKVVNGHYYLVSGEVGIYYNNTLDKGIDILLRGSCEECNNGQCNSEQCVSSVRPSNNSIGFNHCHRQSIYTTTNSICPDTDTHHITPFRCCHVEFLKKITAGSLLSNCFDLMGIHTNIVKVTLTECVLSNLTNGRREIDCGVFEKCCLKPLWQYFGSLNVLLEMGSLETRDLAKFSELATKLGLVVPPVREVVPRDKLVSLRNQLLWVESGCLRVGGVLFNSGRVLGYMGLVFGNHRGTEEAEAIEDTVFWVVEYTEITKRPLLDTKLLFREFNRCNDFGSIHTNRITTLPMLDNNCKKYRLFPRGCKEDVWRHEKLVTVIGATSEWMWLEPHQTLVEQNERCGGVYLLDEFEIGNQECFGSLCFEEGYMTDKECGVVRVDRVAIDYAIPHVWGFYERLNDKIHTKAAITKSLVLLITPAKHECYDFVRRLHGVLGDAAVMVRRADVLKILGGQTDKKLCEFLVTEYLKRLRWAYRVVIVYIENEWSRMLGYFGQVCDLIYIVGYEQVTNRFNRKEVEFVQLHKSRVGAEKLSKKIKRMLSDTNETENTVGSRTCSDYNVSSLNTIYSTSSDYYNTSSAQSSLYKRIHHILCSPVAVKNSLNDLHRITRYLLNEKIGLVLGGGGARGFAHIGVLRALEEEGIPVDCIGGTSMGSLVGALYAQKLDLGRVYAECKKIAGIGSSFWRLCLDFTYPFVSLSSGRTLGKALKSVFKNAKIHNLWLEFYCVTTNLLRQEEKVVSSGTVWKWVRASMSICGYLPPMEIMGDYFVDGAYMNNVPADVMQFHNTETVIAVDVSNWPAVKFDNYDSSSGLLLLFKHLMGYKVYLSLKDIQYRLAFLSTERKIKLLKTTTLLVVPELDMYRSTDFKKFDEIVACGYEAGKRAIKEWKARGLFKKFKS